MVVRQFQERQWYTETYDMLFEIVFKAFFGLKFSTTTHKRGCCVWEERDKRVKDVIVGAYLMRQLMVVGWLGY